MARANLTGPEAVPPDLTRPSAAYRRLTWVVAAAIVGTVGFYVALLGLLVTNLGLTWTLRGTDDPRFALGVVSAVFGVPVVAMLVVSLFDRRKAASDPTELEISAADEPALHASIAEIADRVGAPRPRRVLLVPGVTAAVQYDTTLANLVRPLRKDLVIGLGLVEACTRDQLVAVLAHEFGHFSQSSLRLGVWVYVSTGIVERVSATGAGDRLLRGMAGIDGRLAILAALIQLVLNGVRAALGGLLWVVHLPARALSREQELHADKVAVSIAGSDALIEALARLAQADAAFDAALLRHQGQVGRGSYPADLYRAQSDALTRIEVTHPHLPRIARADPPDPHLRLFADEAPPPAMWATHPDGRTREDSAKAPYVAAPRDDRPAWSLFADPERLRRAMTERVNRTRFGMPADAAPRGADDAPDDAVEVLPAIHVHDYVTIGVADVEAWIAAGPTAAMTDDALVTALAARHGPETRALCTRRSRHVDELRSLLGLATGTRSFDGARFRGQDVYRGEVLGLAAQVRDEWAQDLVAIDDAHRDARRACRAAAERLGPAWVDQHRLALAWLWYAEQEDLWSQATRNQLVALLDRATSGTHTAAGIERMCERLGELHDEFQRTASRLGGMRAPGWPAGAS
ncbi:MAG: M48 family metallopeptidase, partial [Myxococcota bacterium]